MVSAPFMTPAAPKPAMARPTINISEEVETPHSSEPISKTEKKTMKDHFFKTQVRDSS